MVCSLYFDFRWKHIVVSLAIKPYHLVFSSCKTPETNYTIGKSMSKRSKNTKTKKPFKGPHAEFSCIYNKILYLKPYLHLGLIRSNRNYAICVTNIQTSKGTKKTLWYNLRQPTPMWLDKIIHTQMCSSQTTFVIGET